MESGRRVTLGVAAVALLCFVAVHAENIDYYPGNPANWATDLFNRNLQPGDVVTFHAASGNTEATYDLNGFGSTFSWTGTQNNPIVVRANPAHTIKMTQTASGRNIIQMKGSYWVFEGFDIFGSAAATGAIAVRLMKGTNHVVLQDLKVHDIYENAVTANDQDNAVYNNITFRRLDIYNTAGTGECIYVGCQGSGTTTPCYIRDSLIENCYCHDTCLGMDSTECTSGSRGSGFQVKFGSYRNVIRNNVCFNTQGPCILLYDDWNMGANLVEGNVVVDTRDDAGIQVTAGAVIRNNIIINSAGDGINLSNNPNNIYNNLGTRRVTMAHNTIVRNGGFGIRYNEVPSDSHFINNVAIGNVGAAYRTGFDMTSVDWKRNAYDSGAPTTAVNGTFQVSNLANEFINANANNVYPKDSGSLAGAGFDYRLLYDFNGLPRSCAPTVGAYEKTTTNNPGWAVTSSIKPATVGIQPCARDSSCQITDCDAPTATQDPTTMQGPSSAPSSGPSSVPSSGVGDVPAPVGNASSAAFSTALLVLLVAIFGSM